MESFSCKQSLHAFSPGVVEVLLCSYLKDGLCKLNIVLNSFPVSPIYVSWFFEVVSVTVDLCTHAFAIKCRPHQLT